MYIYTALLVIFFVIPLCGFAAPNEPTCFA